MRLSHPIIQEWKGKWVMVHMDFVLLLQGTNFCGRLIDADDDVLVMECGGMPYLIDAKHVLAVYLAVNQDQLTLANMEQVTKVKERNS